MCDQPHPLVITDILTQCLVGNLDGAYASLKQLFDGGYAASDIITTLFRVGKSHEMPEYLKLEFIRVRVGGWGAGGGGGGLGRRNGNEWWSE